MFLPPSCAETARSSGTPCRCRACRAAAAPIGLPDEQDVARTSAATARRSSAGSSSCRSRTGRAGSGTRPRRVQREIWRRPRRCRSAFDTRRARAAADSWRGRRLPCSLLRRCQRLGPLPIAARLRAAARRPRTRAAPCRSQRWSGSTSPRTSDHICTVTGRTVGELRKIETTSSSNEMTIAKSSPDRTAGRISGKRDAPEGAPARGAQASGPRSRAARRRAAARRATVKTT